MVRILLRARAGAAVLGAAVLVGCSPGEPPVDASPAPEEPHFGHVHALGFDPATGALYAASHAGVWALPGPDEAAQSATGPVLIGEGRQDTMGLTVTADGVLYASGHPGPGEAPELSPPVLGLIRSDDGARTWETVSLRGEVDFHALDTAPLGDGLRIVGLDSGTSTLLVSDDEGATWTSGATIAARDVEILADPQQILATTADGLQLSTDGGHSFSILPTAPTLVVVEVTPAGTVVGVDTAGSVWTGSPDLGTWQAHGTLPGDSLQAMTSVPAEDPEGDPLLLVATDTAVTVSRDLGGTWHELAQTA